LRGPSFDTKLLFYCPAAGTAADHATVMDEPQTDSSRERPRWVPYTPPAAEGWDRFWELLRRFSFPVFVLLFVGGAGGGLYWILQMEGDGGPVRLDAPPPQQFAREEAVRPGDAEQVPLTVHSTPAGAIVRANGDSVGTTPLVDRRLATGVYLLSVRAPDHFRTDTVVVLRDSLPTTLRFSLRPRSGGDAVASTASEPSPPVATRPTPVTAVPPVERPVPAPTPVQGGLYVTSAPPGAAVALDGRERGRAPAFLSPLAAGETELAVTLEGYGPWTRSVVVEGDTVAHVHAELEPRTGRLRVLVQPSGTVYINGTPRARASDGWYETALPAGRHRITVEHPVLGTRTEEVDLEAGGGASVIIDLQGPQTGEPES